MRPPDECLPLRVRAANVLKLPFEPGHPATGVRPRLGRAARNPGAAREANGGTPTWLAKPTDRAMQGSPLDFSFGAARGPDSF